MSNHTIQSHRSDDGSEEDQDNAPVQGRVPKKSYESLTRFRESREVYMLHATHRRLQRLARFVQPRNVGVGSGEESATVAALNAACDVEDELENFLEEALAKLDGISRKLDQQVDVLSESILEGDEWYQGGKMFWLDVDEFQKALARATIRDACDIRLHVKQAVNSMSRQELDRLADMLSCRPREGFRLKVLASIAHLQRFGAEGTYHAFHLLVSISAHDWADERCPSARRTRPERRPIGVAWKLFARLIGSGPDKQIGSQGDREDAWLQEFAGIAVSDWKVPKYWDFCAAYRTIRKGKTRSGDCSCPMRRCFAERRQDWLRELAVDEVKGKLNFLAPPDLPVELMDIIFDLALLNEGISG
ncbi:hypothetical protein KC363_g7538 [Hortaea werneckii]|nr:hypothetical protein KC361_g7793 [Hortaea werneckii]KAI7184784.1 hypothetical protein KC363_g7538 [Hortaea werneckii]KAI7505228.1 hypothetical protein KC347_g8052 [Hortaea werneckii]